MRIIIVRERTGIDLDKCVSLLSPSTTTAALVIDGREEEKKKTTE
jgi:hypothetical protein